MPELILENSGWWLLLVALVALLFSWVLYFRGKQFTAQQRLGLAVLRFLLFFSLGLLLLSPLLRTRTRSEEKPLLLLLEDHSSSVMQSMDSTALGDFYSRRGLSKLEDRYQLEAYRFAANLAAGEDSLSQGRTDIAGALSALRERHYNQNVGAVLLISDGIYNRGDDPLYLSQALPFPIYSLASGDTTLKRDVLIDRVVHNQLSYRGNRFPVEIFVKMRDVAGEKVQLQVKDQNNALLFTKEIAANNSDYFERVDLSLEAREAGLQSFRVELSTLAGESDLRNNQRSFSLEVVDDRKQVLIIGQAPHPDMAALKSALEGVEKYQVETFIARALPAEMPPADLIILHDPGTALFNRVYSGDTPLWLIAGENSRGLGPELLPGLQLPQGTLEEVQAVAEASFTAFALADAQLDWLGSLPPLLAPFGELSSEGPIQTLMYKKIGALRTRKPLWFFRTEERTGKASLRECYLLGSGLWRWRMSDYRQSGEFQRFDELISQTVQYLTTAARRKRFEVNLPERINDDERLLGQARLFNPSMELVSGAEVDIVFSDPAGTDYSYSFSPQQLSYRLDAGRLPAGMYQWQARTELGEENFERSGRLLVTSNEIELQDQVANHALLRKMARESGGAFRTLDEADELLELLQANSSAQSRQSVEVRSASIVELRWLFFIFLLLMSLEWGLRKYFGNY